MNNNKTNEYKTDPLFDGHLEKTIKEMTPDEKIDYLWQMVEFRFIISNRQNPNPKENS